jgi:uncharacterized protein (TIGR03083 family)
VSEVLDVLAGECAAVSGVLLDLTEQEFTRPTRCPPWDVKDLLAHMWRALFRIPTALDEAPLGGPPNTDSVTYWRSYDPATDSAATAEHAHDTAIEYGSGRALATAFDELWKACVARCATEDPKRVIKTWWGPRLELDEFLATRVLEMLVHGIDLTAALGRSAVATDAGTKVVVGILRDLLGGDPPIEWSDLDFVDKACGRVPLTAPEKSALGPAARKFPLLG